MPLFNVNGGRANAYKIEPNDVEESQYVEACKRNLDPRRFARAVKTVDEAVDFVVANGLGKLIWTKAGASFGHRSKNPHDRINHLWDAVVDAVGDGKECLITVGCLLRWRIALRPETWLLWVEETDDIDPDTGNKIKVSQYWVDNSFLPPKPKKPKTIATGIDALREQWGAR